MFANFAVKETVSEVWEAIHMLQLVVAVTVYYVQLKTVASRAES
jgi:hypothetical protein